MLKSLKQNEGNEELFEKNKAALLFYSKGNTFGIYQLKDGEGTRDFRFESYDRLQEVGLVINPLNYKLIYVAPLESGMSLESIFEKFNSFDFVDRPVDFTGHSLSVSDVVVLHQYGKNTAHYVDRVGYQDVSNLFLSISQEQKERFDIYNNESNYSHEEELEIEIENTYEQEDLFSDEPDYAEECEIER